jgi:hypothetical protein
MTRWPKVFQKCATNASSNLSGDPFMLFDYQFERSDGASKQQAVDLDQANTMKVRRELVNHHVPT